MSAAINTISERDVARDITYAYEARYPIGRGIIRALEAIGGRRGLIRRAAGYAEEVEAGANFWELMYERYGLSLEIISGSLENIPSDKPVILVANHPYGILDGLTMGLILSRARGEFKILANRVFRRAKDLDEVILPISFEGGKEAMQVNINSRKEATELLNRGGILGIFPGGTVSTAPRPFGEAYDPSWARMPVKLLTKSDAVVVPVYFEGKNSRIFQIASHIHSSLRLGLLMFEFRRRIKNPVRVHIGEAISREEIAPFMKDAAALKDYLRRRTYALGNVEAELGHEFEEKYRGKEERAVKRIY